ncbi:MAG: phage major capsid protein, partial [Oxalobacteraceae bacterium]
MSENKNMIAEVNSAFKSMKDSLAENLKSRDALTEQKIARMEAEIAEKSARIDEIALAAARGSTDVVKSNNDALVRKGFNVGLRKGFDKIDEATLKMMAVGDRNNADGGFLVPDAIYGEIQKKLWENNPIRTLAHTYTTSSSHLEFLQEGSEVGSAWVAETAPRPETATPQINSMKVNLYEHYAEPRVTRWILEDAAFDLEAYIAEKVGERFARQQALAFLKGNGTTQPLGLLNSTSTTVSDANTVKAIVTSTAGKVLPADLYSLVYDLETPNLPNAAFLMNRGVMASIRSATDSTGQFLWQ